MKRLVKQRDNYRCQRCGTGKSLTVHHIKPQSTHPELAKDPENMITLCRQCHNLEHRTPKIKNKRPWSFTSDGIVKAKCHKTKAP